MASGFTRIDHKGNSNYGGGKGGKHAKITGGHVKWGQATTTPSKAK